MSTAAPIWRGGIETDGRLEMDDRAGYLAYRNGLRGKRIEVIVRPERKSKSLSQLGYLFGVVYPVIAEHFGYEASEIEEVHDELMRVLRGNKPDPNPLKLRETLRDKDRAYVSAYIEEVRRWAAKHGIQTPDAGATEE